MNTSLTFPQMESHRLTMAARATLFCCLFLLTNGDVLASPDPTPPAGSKASAPLQSSTLARGKTNADDAKLTQPVTTPVVIHNVFSPTETKAPSGGDFNAVHAESSWKGIWEAIVAIATAALALITWGLVHYTKRLWNSTSETLKLAREEFVASHRPRIILRQVSIPLLNGGEASQVLEIRFMIANTGDTSATLKQISTNLWIAPTDANLPAIPLYRVPLPMNKDIASGQAVPEEHRDSNGENASKFAMLRIMSEDPNNRLMPLLFYGYVEYEDGLGRTRRTAFLRQYNFATGRFDAINHTDYEYQD